MVTVVISRDAGADAARATFEETLSRKLAERGYATLVVPDLYHAADAGPAAERLARVTGPMVVMSWLRERAMYWLLRARGVEGRRAQTLDGAGAGGERPVVVLNLADRCCPGRWLEKVVELAGAAGAGIARVERVEETIGERWYPVLDYERCTACGECAGFCLFGVYEEDGGQPVASDPDACKPGCPACSRVCPAEAIMFPLYAEDEVVAGADSGHVRAFDPDAVERMRAQVEAGEATVEDVVRACGCQADGKGKPEKGKGRDAAYFDDVIDDVCG